MYCVRVGCAVRECGVGDMATCGPPGMTCPGGSSALHQLRFGSSPPTVPPRPLASSRRTLSNAAAAPRRGTMSNTVKETYFRNNYPPPPSDVRFTPFAVFSAWLHSFAYGVNRQLVDHDGGAYTSVVAPGVSIGSCSTNRAFPAR